MIYANLDRDFIEKWWSLVTLTGVGAKLPHTIWKKNNGRLELEIDAFEGRALKMIQKYIELDHAKVFSNLLDQLGPDVDVLMLGSPSYPKSLLELDTPPIFLFVKGDIDLLRTFGSAVVGTRRPDREALRLTDMVVQQKVVRGHTIISGGAIGVDTAAHESALDRNGKTIVVAPSGIHTLTPSSNRILFRRIVEEGGCIVSEYPPFSKPRKFHFHRRNAVLAALSNEVIVVRAAKKSGTLITAQAALKLGKPVYSIPGSPLDPISEGSNALLQKGVASYFDFNEKQKKETIMPRPALSESELRIYELLSSPKTIDEIYELINSMQPNEILSHLTMMEMSGYIMKDRRIGAYRRD